KTTTSAPGQFPYVRGTKTNNDWAIRQNICACKNARKANAKVLEVLNKGIPFMYWLKPTWTTTS
ncbi:MAG: hypothetical protein II197_04860, partial [Peptococcaceae bacterium]|nr:hypothetical protein [Peptococcaceae bacterium]